jgi:PEP-CTERM motif
MDEAEALRYAAANQQRRRAMIHRLAAGAALAAAAIAAPHALAGSGHIDSFGASATEVVAGSWVDFSVSWSVVTSSWSWGGSNTTEPPPQEGFQEWNVNWYYSASETAESVVLQVGSESTTEFLSVPPGSSTSGGWTVSLYFATPGQYTVSAGGSWAGSFQDAYSSESAYRNCWSIDPDDGGALQCDSWTWQYADGGDRYSIGGDFAAPPLTIQVTAVPEPGTLPLWLAGATLLAGWARRRL